jgi:hypothetical protein
MHSKRNQKEISRSVGATFSLCDSPLEEEANVAELLDMRRKLPCSPHPTLKKERKRL